ncbi:ATP-binding protein [Roseivirga sp.]|uniref:ATP-binding protein n=1 Tax=Roseivirga sp. TaxID=1964215 RepID=UPI002B26E09F|nr:ATP-binding protein [Roseivirga sp.]
MTAQEVVKVLENIKNEKSANKINALKDQLDRAKGDDRLEMGLNERLGRESKWVDNVKDSYQYYTRTLYLAEKLGEEKIIAIACFEIANNIRLGNVLGRPYKFYFQRAIGLFETVSDPLSKSYLLYAKVMLEHDHKMKLGYAEEAIALLKSDLNKSDTLMMESLARHLNVAGSYQKGELAIKYFQEGLSVAKEVGNYILQAHILNNIGNEFLVKREYDKAIPYHLEALDISMFAGMKGLGSNSFNNLSICYRNKGMYKEALDYYHCFFYIQSDINTDNYYQNLAEVQVTHEVDRVELKNNLLLSEQKLQAKQRLILFVILFLLMVIVGFIFWSRKKISKTNEKLQALDKVKSRLFANISHELRTPLTLINAPLESLIHNGKIDDPEILQTLETASRNGVNLLSLVEEILDLAKLDAGKLELVENPVRVNNFIELLLSDYKSGFEHKSISLSYKFYPKADLAILIDENKCTKIINNLFSNALKFMPEGGCISVVVDEDIEDNLLFIKVTDSGVGIHPADIPFVFDRYYQSDQPDKKAEGGTGIGLALAKELTVLHGGRLKVDSELGQGTTFTLILPIKEVFEETIFKSSVIESQEQELESALTETISNYATKFKLDKPVLLVTEDHPEMRAFITKTLAPYFEVKQAENGKIALDILKAERIDIVISDVMMPVMDGFELLEAIKKDKALHQVSLVMLTARADHVDKLYALTLGIDDYLTKPFSSTEFLARIKNILENRIKIIRKLDESTQQIDIEDLVGKYNLVEREAEILYLLAKRYSNPEIAEALFISINTVKFHIKNIYGKLGIKTRKEVAERVGI